jgi:hypothetical protein
MRVWKMQIVAVLVLVSCGWTFDDNPGWVFSCQQDEVMKLPCEGRWSEEYKMYWVEKHGMWFEPKKGEWHNQQADPQPPPQPQWTAGSFFPRAVIMSSGRGGGRC